MVTVEELKVEEVEEVKQGPAGPAESIYKDIRKKPEIRALETFELRDIERAEGDANREFLFKGVESRIQITEQKTQHVMQSLNEEFEESAAMAHDL